MANPESRTPDDAKLLARITTSPDTFRGRPCVRSMRIRVIDVLGWLEAGMSRAEILDDFPDLEDEDISACLAFAAKCVDSGKAA